MSGDFGAGSGQLEREAAHFSHLAFRHDPPAVLSEPRVHYRGGRGMAPLQPRALSVASAPVLMHVACHTSGVRPRRITEIDFGEAAVMDITEALGYAADGGSVLFVGAGFSLGATNARGSSFITGPKLARFLADRCALPDETPLEDAAEFFASRFGLDELIKELRREFTVKAVTPVQETLASVPWRRIYTTNYDNVLETAAAKTGKVVVPVDPAARVHLTPKGDPLCIHLNGHVDNLDRSTIWNSFKLTDTSYSTASIEHSEWAVLFRQDVRFARSVFFIGYSLFDLDIKRILNSTPELADKTFFILHDAVDKVTELRASRYGHVLKIGAEGLANSIRNGGFLGPRNALALNIGRSVVEYVPPGRSADPTDQQFLDLIMLGEFRRDLSATDPAKPNMYYCERPVCAEAFGQFASKKAHAVVLHSDVANGKTIALEAVAKIAASRGWRVFWAAELTEYAGAELAAIAGLPGKVLLVIDDYVDWLRDLRGVTSVAGDQFAIVAAARSNAHDIGADELGEVLGPVGFQERNLNALDEDELAWWVNTLDTYGLWGEHAGKSAETKVRLLADGCSRQVHGILLRLFNSPAIKRRLADAAAAVKNDPLAEKVAITAFALTILNQRPTVDTLVDIWGLEAVQRDSVRRNTGISSFIDLSRSSIRVRSTAAAEYLLTSFWRADVVAKVLLEMARSADQLYNISLKYETLFKTLMRFASLQLVLPEEGRRDAVIFYYENLKLLARCQRSPLFWLQYAIGALVLGDLQRSGTYFDTSYSLAERLGWDTFQIDNHYARYLLVQAAEKAPFEEAVPLFRQARGLINRQIRDDKFHYPYRVACTYQAFFDRFQSKFSDGELREVLQAAATVAERISRLPPERAANRYVRQCEAAMRYICDSVESRLTRPAK